MNGSVALRRGRPRRAHPAKAWPALTAADRRVGHGPRVGCPATNLSSALPQPVLASEGRAGRRPRAASRRLGPPASKNRFPDRFHYGCRRDGDPVRSSPKHACTEEQPGDPTTDSTSWPGARDGASRRTALRSCPDSAEESHPKTRARTPIEHRGGSVSRSRRGGVARSNRLRWAGRRGSRAVLSRSPGEHGQ